MDYRWYLPEGFKTIKAVKQRDIDKYNVKISNSKLRVI